VIRHSLIKIMGEKEDLKYLVKKTKLSRLDITPFLIIYLILIYLALVETIDAGRDRGGAIREVPLSDHLLRARHDLPHRQLEAGLEDLPAVLKGRRHLRADQRHRPVRGNIRPRVRKRRLPQDGDSPQGVRRHSTVTLTLRQRSPTSTSRRRSSYSTQTRKSLFAKNHQRNSR
jgi:hypothetical protein